MYKKLGLEKDLKLKARFLELLLVLAAIVLVLSPGQRDAYLLGTALAFSVFGLMLYTKLVNGQTPEHISETMPVGFTFAGVLVLGMRGFYTVNALPVAILYLLSIGYIVSTGLLSEARFWNRYQKYSPADIKQFLQELKNTNREEVKKRISEDEKNLVFSFTLSFVTLAGVAGLYSIASNQPITVNHAIEITIGTMIGGAFLDRWILN